MAAWDQNTLNQYAADAKSLGWEKENGGKKIWDWAQQNGVDNNQLTTALNSAYGGNRDAAWATQYTQDQGWTPKPATPAPAMPTVQQPQTPQFAPVQAAQVQGLGVDYKPALQGLLSGQVNNPYLGQIAGNIADQTWQGYNRGTAGNIRDQFQAAGQFGSSRQGIAEGIAMGDTSRGIADATANLYGGAYEAAQGRQAQIAGQLAGQSSQENMMNAQLKQQADLANSGRDVDLWKAGQGFDIQRQGQANEWALGQGGLGMQQQGLDLQRLTQSQNYDLGNRGLAQQGDLTRQGYDVTMRGQDLQNTQANRGYDLQNKGLDQTFDLGNRTLTQNGLLTREGYDVTRRGQDLSAKTAEQGYNSQAMIAGMNNAENARQFDQSQGFAREQFGYNQQRTAAQDMRQAQFDPLTYANMQLDVGGKLQDQQQRQINADMARYDYEANGDWNRYMQYLSAVNGGQGNTSQTGGGAYNSPTAAGLGGALTGAQMAGLVAQGWLAPGGGSGGGTFPGTTNRTPGSGG